MICSCMVPSHHVHPALWLGPCSPRETLTTHIPTSAAPQTTDEEDEEIRSALGAMFAKYLSVADKSGVGKVRIGPYVACPRHDEASCYTYRDRGINPRR